ncbi:MAG TPA: tRNA (adenosine(37)-N6)-threonylcarbamoyltransferase complex ATPase subunit type 1 TsaE [Armatimonadota bacterium]|nr:tRNA (adenosine(37)-N6)-threonylcarbamoyltransferase complex ATPase subunit type 1 TsaE [Armatimonadota bacterium]
MRVNARSADETRALGELLGRRLGPGDVVCLTGELGAGKTTLAQGMGAGLGVAEPVSSPTFALVHEYRGRLPVWHLDTYRVRSLDELIDLSWDDLLAGGGVVLVEWPARIGAALPAERLDVALEYGEGDSRQIDLLPHGERMRAVVDELAAAWARREEQEG